MIHGLPVVAGLHRCSELLFYTVPWDFFHRIISTRSPASVTALMTQSPAVGSSNVREIASAPIRSHAAILPHTIYAVVLTIVILISRVAIKRSNSKSLFMGYLQFRRNQFRFGATMEVRIAKRAFARRR